MSPQFVCIPLPTNELLGLAKFLEDQQSPYTPQQAIEFAIQYWMDNASWKPELTGEPTPRERGYRWGSVFLANGTKLRMKYKSEYRYASIVGDDLVYEGKKLSPNQFATEVSGTARNAWVCVEVRRPSDDVWHLATALRGNNGELSLDDLNL